MNRTALCLLRDLREARRKGAPAIEQRQRARFTQIVAFSRARSPYYRELYRVLPQRVEVPALLPIVTKKALMARFDEWATDREITIERARAFVENGERVGELFLGKYIVATTSGTTGTPGIFVLDQQTMDVTNAVALRLLHDWLGFTRLVRLFAGGVRMAMTTAPSHSATGVAAARLKKSAWGRKRILDLSVHAPLEEVVERLKWFRPTVLAPYASVATLLAKEQEAGRLDLRPLLITLAARGTRAPRVRRNRRDVRREASATATPRPRACF